MGHKAGSGLGIRSQGMPAPVSDLIELRVGRSGLGYRDPGIQRGVSDPLHASSCSLFVPSLSHMASSAVPVPCVPRLLPLLDVNSSRPPLGSVRTVVQVFDVFMFATLHYLVTSTN